MRRTSSRAAAAVAWLLLAGVALSSGVAQASTDTYLSRLQEEIPNVVSRYGDSALLGEGNKVCDWAAQNVPDDDPGGIIDRIRADLPMSSDAAIWVKDLAEDELGC